MRIRDYYWFVEGGGVVSEKVCPEEEE